MPPPVAITNALVATIVVVETAAVAPVAPAAPAAAAPPPPPAAAPAMLSPRMARETPLFCLRSRFGSTSNGCFALLPKNVQLFRWLVITYVHVRGTSLL
jgi:hypothetical protein